MQQTTVRYLKPEEKNSTKSMYQENFPEDSQEFVDYYYGEKTRDNEILVMEEQGQMQAMVHLNPYKIQFGQLPTEVHYIVAVATAEAVRRQGKMAVVLKSALRNMAKAHEPFTFLIPANPKVYESSGFVFVKSDEWAVLEEKTDGNPVAEEVTLQYAEEGDIPDMVDFAEETLRNQYDLFVTRDKDYYRRMLAEVESEHGGILLGKYRNQLVAMGTFGQEEHRVEVQELISKYPQFLQEIKNFFPGHELAVTRMDYMVRILDLKTLCLFLCSPEPFSLKVQVLDDIIPENQGCFEIKADKEGSSISAISKTEVDCTMDIGALARFLFGKIRIFIREWV